MSQIAHPKHYNQGKIEVIEFIEDKELNFHKGNAVKYIARAGLKDPKKYVEDLKKAIWYLEREIELQGEGPRRPNDMNKRELPKEAPKFDPKKHVDKSLYAYTTMEALSHLNNEEGKIIMSRRPLNMGNNPSKVVFCKITPLENEVKHD